jgi:hypothetical protein
LHAGVDVGVTVDPDDADATFSGGRERGVIAENRNVDLVLAAGVEDRGARGDLIGLVVNLDLDRLRRNLGEKRGKREDGARAKKYERMELEG